MERVRAGAAAKEASELAPQAFAHAEEERGLSRAAAASGDAEGASLYAERAVAAYSRAFVLARLARASRELSDANTALAEAEEQARQLAASRAATDREGDELDKQLKVAKETIAPPPSGPADPQREAARLVAARSLVEQARLLCGAARLVGANAQGLAEAEKAVDELEKRLQSAPRPKTGNGPMIDAAARARAECLAALTRARRSESVAPGSADALLAELAAAAGWDPARDERGVVVTLRGAWSGTSLAKDAEAKLKELGAVAAAHPGFAVQLVVHDSGQAASAPEPGDAARADAAAKALALGGADTSKVHVELAGARAPIVDPSDHAHKARNARLDVVFVAPGN
jgi:flagellar motor protein MotB